MPTNVRAHTNTAISDSLGPFPPRMPVPSVLAHEYMTTGVGLCASREEAASPAATPLDVQFDSRISISLVRNCWKKHLPILVDCGLGIALERRESLLLPRR